LDVGVARGRLIEALSAIHGAEAMGVRVVFDGRSHRADRDGGESRHGIDVVFAAKGQTADGFIERAVAEANDPAAHVVATADGAERETVLALGASCVSPDELLSWVERCRNRSSLSAKRRPDAADLDNRLPL
jgi:predicted RNA-binding protein with PIN domain